MRGKHFYLSLFLLLAACGKPAQKEDPGPPAQAGPTVKVMTYNIYGARASSGTPADLEAIAAVINAEQPDLVALQEVDVFTRRTGTSVHQARELARLTGMEWFFTKAIDVEGGEYGDAVLSKLPVEASRRYTLPVAPGVGGEFRSVAMIRVTKEERSFYFASTHLDHLAKEDNRLVQAAALKEIVTALDLPLILAGDLNAVPGSETISIIRSFMHPGCLQQCPLTFPSDKPDRTIDYIMTTPVNRFSIDNYRALTGYINTTGAYASDHRPVAATVEIR